MPRSDRWIVSVCLVASAVMVLAGSPSTDVAEHTDDGPSRPGVESAARSVR
jgi:hypothetical protein